MIRIEVHNDIPEALNAYSEELDDTLVESTRQIRRLMAERAVLLYMRAERPNSSGRFPSRSPSDSGPLRMLTRRLSSAVLAGDFSKRIFGRKAGGNPESEITEIREGTRFGVRQTITVPYAAIHEFGGIAGRGAVIPPRPYIQPALDNVRAEAIDIVDSNLQTLAFRLGL